jgi:hypothetical protein
MCAFAQLATWTTIGYNRERYDRRGKTAPTQNNAKELASVEIGARYTLTRWTAMNSYSLAARAGEIYRTIARGARRR